MKIAYVILHYMAGKDTIECVESILAATNNSRHQTLVIVVDNGSTNNSGAEIKTAFNPVENVVVIRSDENLGFARGNNLGYQYAKHKWQADFIVQLNNDTILSQVDFNEVLVSKYMEKKYAVLGPDIKTADGYHQNPGNKQSWSLKELAFFRWKKRIQIVLSYLHLGKNLSSGNGNDRASYRKECLDGDVENTILHGACYIFSPLFIRQFEGMCSDTFLYMEEDILKLQADIYGFLMLYSSEVKVFHKEDVATNMMSGSKDEKIRRKYRQLIHSSKVYSRLRRKMMFKKKVISAVEKFAGAAKGNKEAYRIDLDIPISYLMGIIWQRGTMLIRGKIRTVGMKETGKVVFVGKQSKLRCKSKMVLGTGVTIQDNVYMDALSKNGIKIGAGSSIGSGTIIRCSGNFKELGIGFTMGKNSSLADNCFVGATGGVWIGDDVIGGQCIRFHSSNHKFDDENTLIRTQGVVAEGIHVGNNCWIGAGVVFCDGVTIGDGCVIGANAVVTKDFPENSIIAGVPARLIGERSKNEGEIR